MSDMPESMTAEFDTFAGWTADAVEQLGPDYALPAGCRGSGSPAALAWLCEALQLKEGTALLDVGAGVGGPGAFAAQRYAARPVLTDPMPAAVSAARRLFELPCAVAQGEQLPFADGAFPVAWALGVLCTTTHKQRLLQEVRRVLRPSGALGLLVLLRTVDVLPEQPEGNSFPTYDEVRALLDAAGFALLEEADVTEFAAAPVAWQAHVDRVEEVIRAQHADDPSWQAAEEQSGLIGDLLGDGSLRTLLMHAVAL